MTVQSLSLRFKILLPVGLVLGLFCFSGFLATHFIQRGHLEEMIEKRINSTGELFASLLEVEAETLQGLSEAYSSNKSFQDSFLAGDRDNLFQVTQKTFADIRTKYNITHFYFHLPDNRCFLRVHNPPRHSDLIDRHTIKQASLKLAAARGLELGPLGTLTLRVVVPWFINGKLAGYIELGKEIDHITPRLKQLHDIDLIIAINKKFLDRKSWEAGLKVMNKTGNWDNYPQHIITASTLKSQPLDFGMALVNHDDGHSKELFDLIGDDGRYRVGTIPLIDAGGTEVGDIFVLRNLDEVSYGQQAFIFFLIISVILIIAFYFLLSVYLGNIDKNIQEYQNKLKNEIEDHEATEKQLADHQQQLDKMVKQKTGELEEAMAEVKILSGFLPICASCKSIRSEQGKWEPIESYIRDHSEAEFSHSYCPKCAQKLYSDFRK